MGDANFPSLEYKWDGIMEHCQVRLNVKCDLWQGFVELNVAQRVKKDMLQDSGDQFKRYKTNLV